MENFESANGKKLRSWIGEVCLSGSNILESFFSLFKKDIDKESDKMLGITK